MLTHFYAHNFKCLQNFSLILTDIKSTLIFGKNGSGKTTIFDVMNLFQQIGRGITPLRDLVSDTDWWMSDTSTPMQLELTALINNDSYQYQLVIEWPADFKEPRIQKETLIQNNKAIIQREQGQVVYNDNARFLVDWHHIALPIISVQNEDDPVAVFRDWLKQIIILSPFPRSFHKESKQIDNQLVRIGENLLDWARDLTSDHPEVFVTIVNFMKARMSDLETFRWEKTGLKERRLEFVFKDQGKTAIFAFAQLSDGEKIFFLSACLLAFKQIYPNLLLLWDEPDNFVSLPELSQFITEFRRSFELGESSGQLIMTSHNEQVMNEFGRNAFYIDRQSHLSPSRIEYLRDKSFQSSSLADAYYNGELEWQ